MSTAPWNPDAEPWQVLSEANGRELALDPDDVQEGYTTGFWRRVAGILGEMGWHLMPGDQVSRLLGDSARVRELAARLDRHHRESSESSRQAIERICELEAEVKRLREAAHAGDLVASVPVPESDDLRERVERLCDFVRVDDLGKAYLWQVCIDGRGVADEILNLRAQLLDPSPVPEEPADQLGADLSRAEDELREIVDAINDALGYEYPSTGSHAINLEGALAGVRELAERRSSPPEEPEGELRQRYEGAVNGLEAVLRRARDHPGADLSYGWQWVREDRAWLDAHPAPVPVEEPDAAAVDKRRLAEVQLMGESASGPPFEPSPAPEIKAGQRWRQKRNGLEATVDDIEYGYVYLKGVNHAWPRGAFVREWEPSVPSLNPEGLLAWLDRQIENMEEQKARNDLSEYGDGQLIFARQAREWLVSGEGQSNE